MISFISRNYFVLPQRIAQVRCSSSSSSVNKTCSLIGCKHVLSTKLLDYANALESENTYEAIKKLAHGCRKIHNDHFSGHPSCHVTRQINIVTRRVFEENSKFLACYDEDTAMTILSALLKVKDLATNQSDLTGDGGKQAFEILKAHEQTKNFDCVIDIGGQDAQFVKNFSNSKKNVIDINTLTPFLDKTPNVQYAIGDAAVILSNNTYLKEPKQRTLFAMNNLINVLTPHKAWELLNIVTQRMKKEDKLIITGLDKEHFLDNENYELDVDSCRGIVPVYHKKTKTHYKSSIDSTFSKHLMESHSIVLIEEKQSVLYLKNTRLKIKFRTIFFGCNK